MSMEARLVDPGKRVESDWQLWGEVSLARLRKKENPPARVLAIRMELKFAFEIPNRARVAIHRRRDKARKALANFEMNPFIGALDGLWITMAFIIPADRLAST
ncbi:hypothetical protein M407DRAFT_215765 [Tulasnella calospora MUT 4182]|uniref:Uncharacterized protein n=1 Tax=Tulasnella calospora MUT 4182 TaxID=1051891 RepID=A0A0C3LNH1_9AGAM|nr:hypothetical protein M407DRAFT_215765 [Tulasnella calospora MUT 4182]